MRGTPTTMTAHDPASRAFLLDDDLPEGDKAAKDAERNFYSRAQVTTGLDLLPYFVRWLDYRMGRQAVAERFEELQERYPEAAQAHRLKKRGMTQAQIAAEMGMSQATISRLLQRARLHIAHGSTNLVGELSGEERFALLYDQHPIPCEVYVYASYGWRYDRIAETFNISERTVKRYVATVREHLGEHVDRQRLKRFVKAA